MRGGYVRIFGLIISSPSGCLDYIQPLTVSSGFLGSKWQRLRHVHVPPPLPHPRVCDQKIENGREYKYLGLLFTPSGDINSAPDDSTYWSLKGKLGNFFSPHVVETMNLFDTLVTPTLTYSSDLWGCLKLRNNNPVENVHTMFCKHILGVNK